MLRQLLGIGLLFIVILAAGCSGIVSESVGSDKVRGQEDKQEESEAALNYEGGGGFLWKVVHGETTMYVQGTTHLGREDFYPLAPEIEKAYKSSDVVLPEVNMLEAEVDEEEMKKTAMFGDGTTLKDVLPEKSYAALSEIFKENEMAIEEYNNFQPWFVESLLAQISTKKSEVAPEYGVDLYFLKRSLEDEKEIVELESVETQNKMLSNFSMKTQVRMLESSINAHDEVAASLNQIGYNWIKGKENAFADQLTEGFMENGEEYKQAMIDTRNRNMANKLDDILREDSGQTYFAIIGSAHVLVDPSVPGELEEKGYKVERIY